MVVCSSSSATFSHSATSCYAFLQALKASAISWGKFIEKPWVLINSPLSQSFSETHSSVYANLSRLHYCHWQYFSPGKDQILCHKALLAHFLAHREESIGQ